jgi:hypothetical protein
MRGIISLACGIGLIAVGLLVEVGPIRPVALLSGAFLAAFAFRYSISRGRRHTHAGHVVLGVVGGCSTLLGACGALAVGFFTATGCPIYGDPGISYAVENRSGRPLTVSASGVRKEIAVGDAIATADLAPCGHDPEPFEAPRYVVAAFDGGEIVYCHAFSYNDITARARRLRIDRWEDTCTPEQRPR